MTSETVWNRTNLHLTVLSLIKQEVFDLQECTRIIFELECGHVDGGLLYIVCVTSILPPPSMSISQENYSSGNVMKKNNMSILLK